MPTPSRQEPGSRSIALEVNGTVVEVPDDGASLLEVLRDRLRIRSPKDGCSPQGQCGCCTVLVDGQARVSCVTPARRVEGRAVTTIEAIPDAAEIAAAFAAVGASQCGFCTPGIICRLVATRSKVGELTEEIVADAMKAHLCRCTGWQTIAEAAVSLDVEAGSGDARGALGSEAGAARATLEGHARQSVGVHVALGNGGFADDSAPVDSLVAVRDAGGEWVLGETLTEARANAGKVQGRRTTLETAPPIAVPSGDWHITLQTNWCEPAYLETDASWCSPGGEPVSSLGNGGAFGGKVGSEAAPIARRLADRTGRPVRVLFSREDTVRTGPKRPPLAAGIRPDGTGALVVAETEGIAAAIVSVAPGLAVSEIAIPGPPTSAALRGAGWVEAVVLLAAVGPSDAVTAPNGAVASASLDARGIHVEVDAGDPLDTSVLRSYCIGAAHMAYSWVTSERLAVDPSGDVLDLTIRSFGIVRAVDTPPIHVSVIASDQTPINGSDAVFAAVAAAVWRERGHGPIWPTGP